MPDRKMIVCKICNKYKQHAAKRLCKACYTRTATPTMRCKGCSLIKNHHAKGYCSYCYNKTFHKEYFRMASRKQYTGVTKEVFDMLPKKCLICGFDKIIEVHHLIPKSKGGSHDITNLIAICSNHHRMVHHGDYREEVVRQINEKLLP